MKHLLRRHIFFAVLFTFLLSACGGIEDLTTSTNKTSTSTSTTSALLNSLSIAYPNGQMPADKVAQAARELAQNPAALKLTAETVKATSTTNFKSQAVTADYKPVTRIQNTTLTGAYFFTIYDTEQAAALANNPNWKLEGPAFWASLAPDAALNPVHRFRNVLNGSYLYTIYEIEKADIIANYSNTFVYEGVAWHAKQTPGTGWSALYRFRNLLNGTYLFSAYESEKDAIVANYSAVFQLEGTAYYVRQDAAIDANIFQKSSIAPSIAIYGFGDSSFVSTTETVTVAGASNSPSGKVIILTPNLNGKDLSPVPLDANGFYSMTTKLVAGDNILVLTAKEVNGLTKTKKIILSYAPNSTIAKDFILNINAIAEGDTKTLTAKLSFSDSSQVKNVEVLSYPAGAVIAPMKDDGVLPDEIKADGLYTSSFSFTEFATGNKCFRAKVTLTSNATYQSGTKCLSTFKLQTNETVNNSTAIEKAIIYLISKQNVNLTEYEKAKNVVEKIKSNNNFQTTFSSLTYTSDGSIYWTSKDGISGVYVFKSKSLLRSLSNATTISSTTAYYVSPHETEFGSPYNSIFTPIIASEILDTKAPSLDVKLRTIFDTTSNTGVLHISTHGVQFPIGENEFITAISSAEVVPAAPPAYSFVCSTINLNLYQWLVNNEIPAICSDYTNYLQGISSGELIANAKGILVTSIYFKNKFQSNAFDNSVIYIDACETIGKDGKQYTDLRDVFFEKGAIAYIGYMNSVYNSYAVEFAKDYYKNLLANNSVGDSFTTALKNIGATDALFGNDEYHPPAYPIIVFKNGTADVSLPNLTLKNGDFESASISPWQQAGDARIVSTLGQYLPTDGKNMGILSTGLGYTTTSGAISQKALIQNTNSTLKFSWNYMSEEFKQYCGSSYQDYFKVTACKKDGTCDILLNKKVDDLCSSVVQSNVVLNNGKPAVWATGWQNQTINISAYRGKAITFKFESSDIGDSAYDTAVLLDSIKLE